MPLKRSQPFWSSFWPCLGSSPGRSQLVLPLLLGGVAASITLAWSQRTLAVTTVDASAKRELVAESLAPVVNVEDDIPEEILRTEIITGARSPLTGEVLSAAEYAQLQAMLAAPAGEPLIRDDLRYLVFLLQFRRAVKPIIPFL